MKTLLFALLTFPVVAFAQFSIGLSTGGSFPLSDFGSKEFENEDSEFANAGIYFDLQPSFYFTENIGLSAVASFAINSVDEESAEEQLSESLESDWRVSSSEFKQWQFLIGPSFRVNNSQFTLNLTPFIGLTSLDNISQLINSPVDFPGLITQANINGDESLTFGGQASISFPLSDRLQLGLQTRYLSNQAEREIVILTVDGQGGIDRVDIVSDTPLNAFQAGLVLAYNL